jgi:hypothetical protein
MTTPNIVQALAAVADDVRQVRKDTKNTAQNFSFRGIDSVLNAVGPAFRKHGVICVPITEQVTYEPMPLASGKIASRCVVHVRYRFHGPASDSIDAVVVGESFDMGDKATAKAYSVAYRTCLLQTLTIPTDDPDPDSEVYEAAPKPRKAPAPKPKPSAKPGAPLAPREAVDRLQAMLAGLNADDLASYGQYRTASGIPKLSEGITHDDADKILEWFNERGLS